MSKRFRWIALEDKTPPPDVDLAIVVARDGYGPGDQFWMKALYSSYYKQWRSSFGKIEGTVTHWMRIELPPEAQP